MYVCTGTCMYLHTNNVWYNIPTHIRTCSFRHNPDSFKANLMQYMYMYVNTAHVVTYIYNKITCRLIIALRSTKPAVLLSKYYS